MNRWLLRLCYTLIGILVYVAVLAAPPNFYAKHQPWMDKYDSSAQSFEHYRLHYDRMQVYHGYFNRYTSQYGRGWVYKDSMACKPTWTACQSWILRDASGNRLYVDWGCSGGTCPQYALDIGNPSARAWWIGELRTVFQNGYYSGVWVDDVNMDWRISNGNGTTVLPIDPRTGQLMTLANWRRYFAEFMEQIRSAFPDKEIAHNAIWYAEGNRTDPYIRRQILAADYFNLERGFTDGGIVGGTGRFSLSNYLAFTDYVHSLGRSVVHMEYTRDIGLRDYALAAYFVTRERQDYISSDTEFWTAPGYWWGGWDVDLGSPRGPRYAVPGGFRRDFTCGFAEFLGPPIRTGRVVRECSGGSCH